MPRGSTNRKPPPSTPSATHNVAVRQPAGQSPVVRQPTAQRASKSKKHRLFRVYANQSSNMIDPEGIESLCKDLGVDHTDIKILILAWKMKAEKQGYFSKSEFETVLKDLKAHTILQLKDALPRLEEELATPETFQDFFGYAFGYCLTEERQKTVDIETVCELLSLVLGPRYRDQVNCLVKYLKVQSEYRALTLDQWINFYRFCNEISGFPDLEKYDSEQAWPVIIDDFVEWMREDQS